MKTASLLCAVLCCTLPLQAADQQQIAQTLTSGAGGSKVITDKQGDVTHLAISNHKSRWKENPAERISEALFVENIVRLPQLEAVALERQGFSDAGYAVLGSLKQLRDVRLHYMGDGCVTSKDAPLFINELPLPLEVLEIKHCFKVSGGCMEKLKPQPELKKLEIDNGYAGSDAVGFIVQSPKLENLQLHRTTMSDADLQRIFAACPELKVLLIRPGNQKSHGEKRITGRSLRGLEQCRELESVVLGMEWKELPWEECLQVLAGLPKLKQLQFAPNDVELSPDSPVIQQLMKARPDITIRLNGKNYGGEPGREWKQEDDGWDWDGGVTTHG